MRVLVFDASERAALEEALGRQYAQRTGKVWNEARGGIVEGQNYGRGRHARHLSVTTTAGRIYESADGSQVALVVEDDPRGLDIEALKGRRIRGVDIPATDQDLDAAWFKNEEAPPVLGDRNRG